MNSQSFLDSLYPKLLITHSNVNESHAATGDFNLEIYQIYLETCMETNNCFNLINNHTYFKGVSLCIELNLSSKKVYWQGNFLIKIGHHHHVIIIILYITSLKVHLRRKNLNIISIVIISSYTGNTLKIKNHLTLVEMELLMHMKNPLTM